MWTYQVSPGQELVQVQPFQLGRRPSVRPSVRLLRLIQLILANIRRKERLLARARREIDRRLLRRQIASERRQIRLLLGLHVRSAGYAPSLAEIEAFEGQAESAQADGAVADLMEAEMEVAQELRDVMAELPNLTYSAEARIAWLHQASPEFRGRGTVLVVAAGTSDLPVAEEAAVTAEFVGNEVRRLYDVGVAGIHRLLANHAELRSASVLIVVAGMEGALPSVVGGLVDRPVIAVPTSVGYGASFGGLAALLAMLNSCAAGVTVVNVDNGFGAAVAASLINRV